MCLELMFWILKLTLFEMIVCKPQLIMQQNSWFPCLKILESVKFSVCLIVRILFQNNPLCWCNAALVCCAGQVNLNFLLAHVRITARSLFFSLFLLYFINIRGILLMLQFVLSCIRIRFIFDLFLSFVWLDFVVLCFYWSLKRSSQ